MHATTVESNSMRVYMRRDDVELEQDGHAEQHSEHAVLPQQQASYKSIQIKTEIILLQYSDDLK